MIYLKNIGFDYKKKKDVFRGLTLTLPSGAVHGLLGTNGTGKTTLLKIICGLLAPEQGEIRIDEQDPFLREPSCYQRILFVPEEFELPPITFEQFVQTTAPFYPHFSQDALSYYSEQFEVNRGGRLDRISMGQRKRAYLAFALACNAEYLILDEPTNGLDIPSKGVFRRMIAGYADESKTVIIATHQVKDVENLIDHVTMIDEKGLLLNSPIAQIMNALYFGLVRPEDSPLYEEDTLAGKMGVMAKNSRPESSVDLEFLFKASLQNRERLALLIDNSPTT